MADASDTQTPLIVKKPFPEDRAIKLAMAREKALAVRRQNSVARKKAELEKMENLVNPPDPVIEPEQTPESVPTPIPEPVAPEPVLDTPKTKKKVKKQPTVIVEQSSDDSDTFEPHQNVVFVKRVRKAKKNEAPKSAPPPSPPPPPKSPDMVAPASRRPQLSHDQQLLQQNYNSMFSGAFLNGRRR